MMQESKICCFHDGIGICEELMGIPIPLSYTRLTSRFLVLWHLTLPIILWDDCNWIVVPATFISAASLFCIEEVSFSYPHSLLFVLTIQDSWSLKFALQMGSKVTEWFWIGFLGKKKWWFSAAICLSGSTIAYCFTCLCLLKADLKAYCGVWTC